MATEKTKAVLAYLDEVLAVGDQTSKEVSDVLTALRGPDNQSETVKVENTNVVRTVALPRTAKSRGLNISMGFGIAHRAKFGVPRPVGAPAQAFSEAHFFGHIERACEVLNIPYRKG